MSGAHSRRKCLSHGSQEAEKEKESRPRHPSKAMPPRPDSLSRALPLKEFTSKHWTHGLLQVIPDPNYSTLVALLPGLLINTRLWALAPSAPSATCWLTPWLAQPCNVRDLRFCSQRLPDILSRMHCTAPCVPRNMDFSVASTPRGDPYVGWYFAFTGGWEAHKRPAVAP